MLSYWRPLAHRAAFGTMPEILRSLVLISHLKEENIDTWIDRLRGVLAVICSFVPGHIPGVGTFYDLLNHFWLGEKPCRNRKAMKKRTKPANGEKLSSKSP